MSLGIFNIRQRPSTKPRAEVRLARGRRSWHERKRAQGEASLDAFAEMLAEGAEPTAAAVALGMSANYGRTLLKKLQARLGWQAV